MEGKWVPHFGQRYYYVGITGEILSAVWGDIPEQDVDLKKTRNVYATIGSAEVDKKRHLKEVKV